MVARGDSATLGDSLWVDLIEGIYAAIEAIPVEGYRSSDSDGWTRARGPTPTTHLSFWVFAGDEVDTSQRGTIAVRSRVLFAARYVAEDHPAHLARAHAAAAAVAARLRQGFTGGGRCLVSGWTPDYSAVEAGWIIVELTFDLHVPW